MIITTRKTISMLTGETWEHEWFEYCGPLDLMCGASQQQKDLEQKQASYYDVMTQQSQQVFGEASTVFNDLQSAFAPIVAAGPNQRGFSDEERQVLNTQATEGVASNYAKAQQAVNGQMASRGGGNAFLPSGADLQAREQLANSAASQESQLQEGIIANDYETGRDNFNRAAGVLGSATGTFNPASTMSGVANSSGADAAETANQITQANNSWVSAVTGLAGGVIGAAATGGMSNLGKGVGFFGQNAPAPGNH